jgi:hypothetical protein
MIKCLDCGNEFSYGRKIFCCSSTHFGMIFNENKKHYKWNCHTIITINKDDKSSKMIINQKELEEREYILLYE